MGLKKREGKWIVIGIVFDFAGVDAIFESLSLKPVLDFTHLIHFRKTLLKCSVQFSPQTEG